MGPKSSLVLVMMVGLAACTAVMAQQAAAPAGPPVCTHDFWRFTFTPCDKSTNTMTAVAYYNASCTTQGATEELPEPRIAPCVKSCGSGTWYSPSVVDCELCRAGSYSNSGGRIVNDFSAFPAGFTTYCSPQPCQPWRVVPEANLLDSGNQTKSGSVTAWGRDESMEAHLVTLVEVINPLGGKFEFSYRVESEKNYDGLLIMVNGTAITLESVGEGRGCHNPKPVAAPGTSGSDGNYDYFSRRNDFLLSGLHFHWRRMCVPLNQVGVAEVRLVFRKDQNSDSSEAAQHGIGLDRAFVRDILVEGVQLFAPKCTSCAAGTFAPFPRSQYCQICPANTFSTKGASRCQVCPSDSYSAAGSDRCIPRLPCRLEDYVAVYDTCNYAASPATRVQSWKLSDDRCLESGATKPASKVVPCAPCLPGFARNTQTQQCEACQSGYSRQTAAGGGTSCVPCQAGSAAIPVVDYSTGFDALPNGEILRVAGFSQTCKGQCAGCPQGSGSVDSSLSASCEAATAFEVSSIRDTTATGAPAGDDHTTIVLRSNPSNGPTFVSTLTYAFTLVNPGRVTLTYTFQHSAAGSTIPANDAFEATAVIDNVEHRLDGYNTGPLDGTLSVDIERLGSHEIMIVVSQNAARAPQDTVTLVIKGLKVVGDSRGAATTCVACRPGYFCPGVAEALFTPCPAGTSTAVSGSTSCSACAPGTIAKDPGASTCRNCPYGTTAAATKDRCINSCHIELAGQHFDLRPLKGVYYGPISPDPASSTRGSFFVNLCDYVNTDPARDTCRYRDGLPVERAYACQRLPGNRSYSAGDYITYGFTRAGGLSLTFSGGDVCNHGGMERKTNISLLCAPDQEGPGQLKFESENPHCQYNFVLASSYGCPSCTANAFVRIEGACHGGVREVKYLRRTSIGSCTGGYMPPAPQNVSCDTCRFGDYIQEWSQCVEKTRHMTYRLRSNRTGCHQDSTLHLPERTEACSTMEVRVGANTFTLLLILVPAIIGVFIGLLVFLYRRHNDLERRYARISGSAEAAQANELHDVDTAHDVDHSLPEDA